MSSARNPKSGAGGGGGGGGVDGNSTLASIKATCLRRGAGGIKGLATLFRRFDSDYSKTISPDEFIDGLKKLVAHGHWVEVLCLIKSTWKCCINLPLIM